MIDRAGRDALALALRRYVSGHISNDELADVRFDRRDRGAKAVWSSAWQLYSDMYNHRATGRHYLNSQTRRQIACWVMFLHSDFEYAWPEYSLRSTCNPLLNFLTLGWWDKQAEKKWQEFVQAGDFAVWPFLNRKDFKHVLRNPRFMKKSVYNTDMQKP